MAISSDSIGLLFRAKGDTDDAKQAFAYLRSSVTRDVNAIDNSAKAAFASFAQSMGLSETSASKLAGALPIVGVAAAGMATAIGAAALGIFNLAKASSDYGSEIFDASQKTGLAAETISAMKFAADQSGTSLDAITSASAKFAKLIAEAADGSEKAQDKLKKLGVTSKDLDTALGEALATIAKLPPGVDQMTAAQTAFGKSGADLLPFIKSFDGDLVALTKKAKELGVTLTDEDAKAADDFGDTLDTLSAQAAGVGRIFVGPMMRDITLAMSDISVSLANNKQAVTAWGESVATTMRGLKNIATEIYNFAQNPVGRALKLLLFGGLVATNEVIQQFAGPPAPLGGAPIPNIIPGYDPLGMNKPKARQTDTNSEEVAAARKAAEDRAKAREAAFQKELANQSKHNSLMLAGLRQSFSLEQKALEESYINGEKTRDNFRAESIEKVKNYALRVQEILDADFEIKSKGKVGTELANLVEEYRQASINLDNEKAREIADVEKLITDTVKKENSERVQDAKQKSQEIIQNSQAQINTLISQFELLKAKGIISERQYAEIVGELKLRQLEMERALTDDASERFRIDQEIKIAKNEMAIEGIEITKQEAEAAKEAAIAYEEYRVAVWNASMQQAELRAQQEQTVDSAKGTMLVVDMFKNAFNGIAQALGNVVQQWVLYGKTGPAVMRQVLASALATIAAEATVRAIYALAMGFFFLATGNYVDATNAFIAAAIFGSIGVGAALAGRAVAGKSFQRETQTASTSSSGSSGQGQNRNGGSAYSGQEDQVVEVGRNAPGVTMKPIGVNLTIALDAKGVLQVVKDSIRSNGEMRNVIIEAVS